MATLTIRDIDDGLKARLRVRAARQGRSMEAEVRSILEATLRPHASEAVGSRVHALFAAAGGADPELPRRDEEPRAADLGS